MEQEQNVQKEKKSFFKKFWESHIGESDEAFANKMSGAKNLPRWVAFFVVLIAAGGLVLSCLFLEAASRNGEKGGSMAVVGLICAMLVCVFYLIFGTIKTAVGNASVKYLILVICACLLLPIYNYISLKVIISMENSEFIAVILFSYVPLVMSVVIRELIRNGKVDEAFTPYVLLFAIQTIVLLPINFVGGLVTFDTVFAIVSYLVMLGYLIYINCGKPKWLVIASIVLSVWAVIAFATYFMAVDSTLLFVVALVLGVLGFVIELKLSK